MAQAWQARAHQRQMLVEEFVRVIHEVGDEDGNFDLFVLEFLIALLRAFKERREGKLSGIPRAKMFGMVEGFKKRIKSFGRTDAERGLILAQLAEKALGMVIYKEDSGYRHDELFNTKAVLGVERATDEIEIIDEDSADIEP